MSAPVMKVEGVLGVKPPGPDFLLILPVILPSLNEYVRMHWAKRLRLNKNIAWHIHAVKGNADIDHRDRLAHVRIRVFSNAPKASGGRARRLDHDNLVGGNKPLVDALRLTGIIKNDTDRWADIGYVECREPVDHPRTEIEIIYNNFPLKTTRAVVSKRGVDDGNLW